MSFLYLVIEEIFDGMAMLSVLAVRELRRDKEGELAEHLSAGAEKLERTLVGAGQWQIQMDLIKAKTSFDVRNHAMRLLRPEFKE